MRRINPASVKVKAPSRGLVTRWPGDTADQLATGADKFSLPGMANRASTFASNVRYEDGVVKNAPGYVRVAGADNIVAHWPLNEATGTRFDTTQNHLDLTEIPVVGQVAGQVDFAAHFPNDGIVRPNWNATVWTLIANQVASGSGGAASSSFLGALFNVRAVGSATDASYVRALGTLAYTGPSAVCNIEVTVTEATNGSMGFFIKQDTTQLLQVQTSDLAAPGVYNFPFTVASTAGSSLTIVGLTDIAQPSRLFVYSVATKTAGAYSALLS